MHTILFSTDLNPSPEKILHFYRQLFQMKLVFRDAQNFTGLEDWLAGSEN